jgi:hypothetical protein
MGFLGVVPSEQKRQRNCVISTPKRKGGCGNDSVPKAEGRICVPEMPMPKRCISSKHKGHDRSKSGKKIKLVSGYVTGSISSNAPVEARFG